MNKGILPINKPKDWTSFDVCNKLKYMLKPLKVGHLGTLDPMATGVLLVTVGKATKLFDIMQEKQKSYVAEFEFVFETDTLDSTGIRIKENARIPEEKEILTILQDFIGKQEQLPPKYSAKNINGKRAYELARNNEEFELKPKIIEIFDLKFISYKQGVLKLEIICGSGTYVRAIGRDIAKVLNTVATMTSLERTRVGKFSIENCLDIHALSAENINAQIIDVDKVLEYPILELSSELITKILNGQKVYFEMPNGDYCLKANEGIVAIVKITENIAKMSIFLGWLIVK